MTKVKPKVKVNKKVAVVEKTNKNFVSSRGSDPEVFLRNRESGEIVSAIDVLIKDKHEPIDLGDGVTTYYDNAMMEFTIAPAFSKQEFINSFKSAFDKISLFLDKQHNNKYEMVIQASHVFDDKYLNHEAAKQVGCNPEYNADELNMITPPDFSGNLRSSGGHLSLGRADYKNADKNQILMDFDSKINLTKLLDYYVGVPFTLIDNDPTSAARRQIYGRCSSHRPKDFGVEYRVLSNYWISSPDLVGIVYDLSEYAIQELIQNKHIHLFKSIDKKLVNASVHENNKELAEELLELMKLPKNLMIRINQLKLVKKWDFYHEWGIKNAIMV